MPTATEHCKTLLAAIIPNRRDLLDRALRHLSPDHFPDRILANIYTMLERYSEVTGAIMTRAALGDLLAATRADAGKIALYEETYDLLAASDADEAAFRWSLEQIRELAAERATGEALTQAMEILTRGAESDRGEHLLGHSAARTHVLQRFAEIDRDLSMQEAPEGDIGVEGDDILAEYAEREAARKAGRILGVEFGIPGLDGKTGGLSRGDLGLVVGYTSEGKTHLGVQLAWHASVKQGLNVVFLTTETIRTTVRRRFIARHSTLEHFEIPNGLNSRDIKDNTLNAEQKQQLAAVVADFSRNPAYGKRWVSQVPRSATISYVESKLIRLQRMFPIDLVILDALYLLRPDRRRNTDREELSNILKESKQLATTFNDGAGVPLISPWQVSRAARQEAERTGYYTSQALSETAEASNSADLIVSLLAPLDNDQRVATLKMQVMKHRDGERLNSVDVSVDYAVSRFTAPTAPSNSMDDMFTAQDFRF